MAAASRRSRSSRRRIAIAATVAAIGLTAGLATGCDAVDKAIDCVQTADTVPVRGWRPALMSFLPWAQVTASASATYAPVMAAVRDRKSVV